MRLLIYASNFTKVLSVMEAFLVFLKTSSEQLFLKAPPESSFSILCLSTKSPSLFSQNSIQDQN